MRDKYQEITDSIVRALEKGTVPWHKPWRTTGFGGPANLTTRRPYRGINIFLLAIEQLERGYATPFWLTFKQAQGLGGRVRKGERGTRIYFFKPYVVEDKETGKKKSIPLLRDFVVFNVEQIDGVAAPELDEAEKFNAVDEAEQIVRAYINGAACVNSGPRYTETASDRAFYREADDLVVLPERTQFTNEETFYSTVFHELVHSTGHKSRLDRELANPFGSEKYAREELVAEIGASFLRGESGINGEAELDQSAGYIANWLTALENDPKLVIWAAGRAQKAADRVLVREAVAVAA